MKGHGDEVDQRKQRIHPADLKTQTVLVLKPLDSDNPPPLSPAILHLSVLWMEQNALVLVEDREDALQSEAISQRPSLDLIRWRRSSTLLLGPTAVGKTSLALDVAETFGRCDTEL